MVKDKTSPRSSLILRDDAHRINTASKGLRPQIKLKPMILGFQA